MRRDEPQRALVLAGRQVVAMLLVVLRRYTDPCITRAQQWWASVVSRTHITNTCIVANSEQIDMTLSIYLNWPRQTRAGRMDTRNSRLDAGRVMAVGVRWPCSPPRASVAGRLLCPVPDRCCRLFQHLLSSSSSRKVYVSPCHHRNMRVFRGTSTPTITPGGVCRRGE